MKILKRPQSSPSNLSAQGMAGGVGAQQKPQPKSLKQREEEYAQARLRILGSTGEEEATPGAEAVAADAASTHSSSPSKIEEGTQETKSDGGPAAPLAPAAGTIRTPRGPDGTKGFGSDKEAKGGR